MTHYFSKDQSTTKSQPKDITFTFKDQRFTFTSDYGVFSKNHVDYATQLLLETVEVKAKDDVLDLGCGYGVIGIVLKSVYDVVLTMTDVNERALKLAEINAKRHQVSTEIHYSVGFNEINKTFDHIISNPPIRIGKQTLYDIFKHAKAHLKSSGCLWIVMHKKHGAQSAMTFLRTLYQVDVAKKRKGFHVIKCIKR